MDAFTNSHLDAWLRNRFSPDDEVNINAARSAIERLVTGDDLWLTRGWPEMLRASDFVERFESERPCHDVESINAALGLGRLFARTDSGKVWQVFAVEFDAVGNVERFNGSFLFPPLQKFEYCYYYGITNQNFYTLA